MLKKIILGLLAVFVILQFFQIKKTNPETEPQKDFMVVTNPPEDIKMILKEACYDCHSHQTKYPWYAYIQPLGWWLKDHVRHGSGELNFSEWTSYEPRKAKHKLEECFEEIEKGEMPLKPYKITHKGARLSDEQKENLIAWFKAQYEAM